MRQTRALTLPPFTMLAFQACAVLAVGAPVTVASQAQAPARPRARSSAQGADREHCAVRLGEPGARRLLASGDRQPRARLEFSRASPSGP